MSEVPGDLGSPMEYGNNDDELNRAFIKDPDFESKDEEQRLEIQSLKARVLELEEELELERIRSKEEQEQRVLAMTEAEALKATIGELEEKLLKAALSQRKVKQEESDEPEIMMEKKRSKSTASLQIISSDSASARTNDPTIHLPTSTDVTPIKTSSSDLSQRFSHPLKGTPNQGREEEEEEDLGDEEDSEAFEFEPRQKRGESISELNKQGLYLNARLENEIRGLSRSISEQHNETRNAHQSAQQYAEKYIKLREEYELHVQVLMLKLTQEQQARTVIEDKLEDAYVRCLSVVCLSFD